MVFFIPADLKVNVCFVPYCSGGRPWVYALAICIGWFAL